MKDKSISELVVIHGDGEREVKNRVDAIEEIERRVKNRVNGGLGYLKSKSGQVKYIYGGKENFIEEKATPVQLDLVVFVLNKKYNHNAKYLHCVVECDKDGNVISDIPVKKPNIASSSKRTKKEK